MINPAPTVSQVKRAGRTLRMWLQRRPISEEDVNEAIRVLWRFRAAHEYALTKATMGLRSVVRTERCRPEVSQRLKRASTIILKLTREPTMQLANMQDIGGCRAVLDSVDELRRVEHRLRKNRPRGRVTPRRATRGPAGRPGPT